MKSILDVFFGLGDKVTRGDPNRQADFMYYMLWILFLAFSMLFVSNLINLIRTPSSNYAVWTLVGFAISAMQFFNLKGAHEMKKMRAQSSVKPKDEPLENVDEMMKQFQDSDKEVEKKDAIRKTKTKSRETKG